MPRLLCLALCALLLGCARLPDWGDLPDRMDAEGLEAALRPAPELPISAAETDVLLVITCTMRKDRMEIYGHDQPTSPFLEELGRRGVVFDAHYAQAAWTRPSVGSITTGRYPRALQLDNPGPKGALSLVLAPEHQTIAELLSEAGYSAHGGSSNPNIQSRFGFTQGFVHYDEPAGTYKDKTATFTADQLAGRLVEQARALPPERRFYGQLVITDTHEPRHYSAQNLLLFDAPRRALRDYDASMRSADAAIARLVGELRALRPNLLVMVVADHGEGLRSPKHHGRGHGNHLYRSVIELPWLVFHPSLQPRRVGGLSANIDLLPTLLGLLGRPAPPEVDGRSQAEVLRGRSTDRGHEMVYTETFYGKSHKSAVFDGTHQLIRDHRPAEGRPRPDEKMFHYTDPAAERDVAAERPLIRERLALALTEWEGRMASSVKGGPVEAPPDAQTMEALRAMGYVED